MELINVGDKRVLYHNNGKELVNVRTIVDIGSSHERHEMEFGSAHFLEHMFFQGTTKHTNKEIKRLGAKLGNQNAYTGSEKTVFHLSCVKDDFKEAADLIHEMLFYPLFSKECFDTEKGVILEEYQMYNDDPYSRFFEITEEEFFGKRGHNIIGRKKGLEGMTVENLMKFRTDFYRNKNVYFGVVGGMPREEVVDYFEKLELPENFLDLAEPKVLPPSVKNYNDFSFFNDSVQAVMCIIYNMTPKVWGQIKLKFVEDVFKNGLGGGMHSMFSDKFRDDLGYCYSTGVSSFDYSDEKALFGYIMLDKKNIGSAHEEMLKMTNKVKTEGFSEDLLETAKKNLIYKLAKKVETSVGFAQSVMDPYTEDPRYLSFEETKGLIQTVTNEDIIEMAGNFFVEGKEKFVKMTNEEKYKPTEYD